MRNNVIFCICSLAAAVLETGCGGAQARTQLPTSSNPFGSAAASSRDVKVRFGGRRVRRSVAAGTTIGGFTFYPIPADGEATNIITAIAAAADGNVWFTQGGNPGPDIVGSISPAGAVTQYSLGYEIVNGISQPVGSLRDVNAAGSATTHYVGFMFGSGGRGGGEYGIGTLSLDGSTLNLYGSRTGEPLNNSCTSPCEPSWWPFLSTASAFYFTNYTAGGMTQVVAPIENPSSYKHHANVGPSYGLAVADGRIWYVTPGVVGSHATLGWLGGGSYATKIPGQKSVWDNAFPIAAGNDGYLWVVAGHGHDEGVAWRFTYGGTGKSYRLPLNPEIAYANLNTGPDDSVWLVETTEFRGKSSLLGLAALARIDSQGNVSEYAIPSGQNAEAQPNALAAGSDGNIWFESGAAAAGATVGNYRNADIITGGPPTIGLTPGTSQTVTISESGQKTFTPSILGASPEGFASITQLSGSKFEITGNVAGSGWATFADARGIAYRFIYVSVKGG